MLVIGDWCYRCGVGEGIEPSILQASGTLQTAADPPYRIYMRLQFIVMSSHLPVAPLR